MRQQTDALLILFYGLLLFVQPIILVDMDGNFFFFFFYDNYITNNMYYKFVSRQTKVLPIDMQCD